MKQQKYGKIMNMSSIRSMLGASNVGYVAYATSKSAVNMLTRQAACELAADHITVNAIMPTMIKTAMNAAQLDDTSFRESLENRIPVGRIGEFRDLMGLMLLLTSDASEFITGQTIFLDGGITAHQ
jgi:gluconate 5-dehydrogenase